MSYQFEIEATIALNPLGVEVVAAYNDTRARWNEWLEEFMATGVDKHFWSRVAERYPVVADYAANNRCDFIPGGGYGSVEPISNLSGSTWEIHCSTANKREEIEAFKCLIPLIATAVDMTITNDDGFRSHWSLFDGIMLRGKTYCISG